ncbi:MAG TPA: hypothetical protein VNO30_21855 [Kofleriaceae bacterium]|nr:hypothetical protein [Kofleriaceae bacterium]
MDEEVDYSTLNDDELEHIARGDDVFSIGPALNALYMRAPQRALPIAEGLLRGDDEWLRATALDIVFHENQPLALDYMRDHAISCGIPVLRVIVEMLAVDHQAPERSCIEDLLVRVGDRLLRDPEDRAIEDPRDLFFRRYPDLRPQ